MENFFSCECQFHCCPASWTFSSWLKSAWYTSKWKAWVWGPQLFCLWILGVVGGGEASVEEEEEEKQRDGKKSQSSLGNSILTKVLGIDISPR